MLRKKLRLTPIESKEDDKNIPSLHNVQNVIPENKNDVSSLRSLCHSSDIPAKVLQYELELSQQLEKLEYSEPVKYVYNPLVYAYDPHKIFVHKYCTNEKKILFVGMNPGPYGMCQTGIPFGEINLVKEWYKIEGLVIPPNNQCPNKKILGFDCHRSEQSGKRLGEFFKHVCKTPENLFRCSFLYNYCPLAFLSDTKNITPKMLKGKVKKELERCCSETLSQIIQLLKVEIIVALGHYAEEQSKLVVGNENIKIIYMCHPSPQIPGNWQEKAEKTFFDHNLLKYFQSDV